MTRAFIGNKFTMHLAADAYEHWRSVVELKGYHSTAPPRVRRGFLFGPSRGGFKDVGKVLTSQAIARCYRTLWRLLPGSMMASDNSFTN